MFTRSRSKPSFQSFHIVNDQFLPTATQMRFQPQALNSSCSSKFQLFFYESVQHGQKKYQRACAYQHHHDLRCIQSAHVNVERLYRNSTMPGVRVQSRVHKEFVKICRGGGIPPPRRVDRFGCLRGPVVPNARCARNPGRGHPGLYDFGGLLFPIHRIDILRAGIAEQQR
jgi:hypothetical protein